MTMIFRYTRQSIGRPIWTLAGQSQRPQPVVTISVIGPKGARAEPGLLDTGADDTVFPERVARLIGLDLTNAPRGTFFGVGSSGGIPVRYAHVTLRLTDGIEFREWPAPVGFTQIPLRRALLGFAGILQFFYALFDGEKEQVELTINANYPGT